LWRICVKWRRREGGVEANCSENGAGYGGIEEIEDREPISPEWQLSCFSSSIQEDSALDVTLQHAGGARFIAESRQHSIIVDQPAEDGASDHGMTPAELLLVALGSCIGQYVSQYLSLRALPAEGLMVRVEAERSMRPLRLREFRVEIVAPGLNERQLRALEKTFPSGLVQNALSLENTVRITAASMHAEDTAL
jgi:putative redox protein